MTDWTPEEDEAFNNVEKHSNLGKQILRDMGQPYVYAPKREWVGLTDEDKQDWIKCMPWPPEPGHLMVLIEGIESELKELNR
jgi:hypothetical protein